MISIVSSTVCSTVGLLTNHVRDTSADKFKDGDVTDTKLREIVIRDIHDIKAKLDGISRKDLLSSCTFLQEGVDFLQALLDGLRKNDDEEFSPNEFKHFCDVSLKKPGGAHAFDETLKLSHALALKKTATVSANSQSNTELECAKERFKAARKRATDAFCNESLRVKDRIFAAKLRVISEILENLDHRGTAIIGCMSHLKKLHKLPAIQEMFSVHLNGGPKSIVSKAERAVNVKSVMLINYVLFQLVSKLRSSKYSFIPAWPTISIADRHFHPIRDWEDVSKSKYWGEELVLAPNKLLLDKAIDPNCSAVNSEGEIFAVCDSHLTVISSTGELNTIEIKGRETKDSIIERRFVGLTVDEHNNVYIVTLLKPSAQTQLYVLNVLNNNYVIKHEHTLDFLQAIDSHWVYIAVNKNKDIVMIINGNKFVYVCDKNGQLKHKFQRDSHWLRSMSISNRNEVMISAKDRKAVNVYAEDGELKSRITVPEGYEVWRVAFHYVARKIIILSLLREKDSFLVLCFSENGELETLTYLCQRDANEGFVNFITHPGGHAAVVRVKSIISI